MKRLYAFLIAAALCFPSIGAMAWWNSIQQVGISAAPTYQGPGDVAGVAAVFWGSCARAYSASYANGTNSLCDLVDASTGTVAICTLRVKTNGFADLAGTYCTGSATPATACAGAAGGSCVISKIYNQVSPGTNDAAPPGGLSNMAGITFADLNGLPTINCGISNANMQAASFTVAQPFVISGVMIRTGNQTIQTGATGGGTTAVLLGGGAANNTMVISAGTAATVAATDSVWHAGQGLFNGASSALNVDGVDNTSLSAGTTAFSANTYRVCRSNGTYIGRVAEAGFWPTGGSVNRAAIYSNQHGSFGYNGGV